MTAIQWAGIVLFYYSQIKQTPDMPKNGWSSRESLTAFESSGTCSDGGREVRPDGSETIGTVISFVDT